MIQESTTAQLASLEPIILVPPKTVSKTPKTKRGFMGTLGLLLAGWFFGNLIFFALVSSVVMGVAGSTGLVKVPLLTSLLFGMAKTPDVTMDTYSLSSAQEKIAEINNLKKDETIPSLNLTEVEINALLDKQIKSNGVSIYEPYLKLLENKFIFSGKLSSTNAPFFIEGSLEVSGQSAKIAIGTAKFGKVSIPSFLASNIVEANFLNKLGFSLSESALPAESLKLTNGLLTLEKVTKPN